MGSLSFDRGLCCQEIIFGHIQKSREGLGGEGARLGHSEGIVGMRPGFSEDEQVRIVNQPGREELANATMPCHAEHGMVDRTVVGRDCGEGGLQQAG